MNVIGFTKRSLKVKLAKHGQGDAFVHVYLYRLAIIQCSNPLLKSGKSTGQTGVTKGAKQLQLSRHTTLQIGELMSFPDVVVHLLLWH